MKLFNGAPVFENNTALHVIYNTSCTTEKQNNRTNTCFKRNMEGKPNYKLHTTWMTVNYHKVCKLKRQSI